MSIKVLVFESDAAFAGELRNELGKLGCSTCVVDDGSVGLQQASAERPDLILLSIELPRMNGFSVCNKLKKDNALKAVPLIIMSSESSDETFEQHRKLRTRAEDYVHKPIAFGELLQHIRTFVPMEAPVPESLGDTDGIVIDDEIAVQQVDVLDDDEGTQIAVRPDIAAKPRAVDAEVDAFTESAFGRLQDAPATEHPRKEANGAREGAAPSTRPGPSLRPSSRAAAANSSNDAELERLRTELARAGARAQELAKETAAANERIARLHEDADAEAERMQRELDELKTRLQQSAKGSGAVSSREFLDLREALNKKDKEILALKESAGKKDRELFEARDKALVFERSQSEFEDKLLAKERELADTREKLDELNTQLSDARRGVEDGKNKIARVQAESDGRAKELVDFQRKRDDENAAHDATLASLKIDHAKALAAVEQERDLAIEESQNRHRAALAEAETRHRGELEQLESKRRAERDQANQEREATVAQVTADAEKARADALVAREKELRTDADAKLASLYRAHQDELGRVKAELGKQLDVAKADGEARLTVQQTELQEQLVKAVAAAEASVRADGDARLAAQQTELQQQLATAVAVVEGRAAAELSDARAVAEAQAASASERIGVLDRDLAAVSRARTELEQAKRASDTANEARQSELSGRLSELSSARDQLERSLVEGRDRIASLEMDLSAVRGELSDTKSRLETESSRLGKAVGKWETDRRTLDRAKDALAVALAQIDEIEGRTLGE